ncbi:MAG: biosynthetic arginine decarboxylase [Verrucomicrobiae bacterium]|nr:biosynthetic arginine decarboxylase [Verrucomicrobiae bacterium]
MSDWTIEKAVEHYRVPRWGGDYFSINGKGNVTVSPLRAKGATLDMVQVIEAAKQRGLHFPMVLRFQDLLRDRVVAINEAFQQVMREQKYPGIYRGVFPIKVNQLCEVVEEILEAGKTFHYGLEAGSKPELVAALALHRDPESLIICNGYKDESFIRLALLGKKLGKQVIIVIEKLEELALVLKVSEKFGVKPQLGFRIKLQVKGAGKWAASSGDDAKFGLTARDLVEACEILKQHQAEDMFQLLHFHMGSQMPDIQIIRRAVSEAARYYAKVRQLNFPVKFVDVGGGLGIDYDGTRSTSESSMNYTLEEYCRTVVQQIAEICEEEKVPCPDLVSESGRAVVSPHSVLVVEVFGVSEKKGRLKNVKKIAKDKLAQNLEVLLKQLNRRTRREVWHEALRIREQAETMFSLGLLDLETKAIVEERFWTVAEGVTEAYRNSRVVPEEIRELQFSLSDQYWCNFSVFQSLVDHWALGQLFPVMPLHHLEKEPDRWGTLVDITCDSDGKVSRFIGKNKGQQTLRLHRFQNQSYWIGFFLVGAYQDVMGDIHNLFGRVNEAHVFLDGDEESGFYIEETIEGRKIGQVLQDVQYDKHELASEFKEQVTTAIREDRLKPSEGMNLLEIYEKELEEPTYLKF